MPAGPLSELEEHSSGCRGAVSDRQPNRQYADLPVVNSRAVQPGANSARKDDRSERPDPDLDLYLHWHPHPDLFGISLPVVQVGGGLVVISTGWALLRRPNDDEVGENGARRECNEDNYSRQAFYPLTLPLTVGPGSISVAITVGANRPEGSEWRWPLIGGMLLGSALISASIYLSYRFAERIGRTLGDSAMNIMIRLSSFILVCIGVQILWNGLSALLRTVVR